MRSWHSSFDRYIGRRLTRTNTDSPVDLLVARMGLSNEEKSLWLNFFDLVGKF
jgi:hypothetical protein